MELSWPTKEIGNGNQNKVEYTTQFSLWCIAKAPLLLGCDLSNAMVMNGSAADAFEIILVRIHCCVTIWIYDILVLTEIDAHCRTKRPSQYHKIHLHCQHHKYKIGIHP